MGNKARHSDGNKSAAMRRLRDERRRAGLCPEDGDPPAPGSKHCQYHLERDRERKKQKALERARAS
jgi:hypothetical protein